jgi:hypothetical protein
MGDEKTTKATKRRGPKTSYTEAEARKAYRLYKVEDLTGDEVAAVLGRPRTTCLLMAAWYERTLSERVGAATSTDDAGATPDDQGDDLTVPQPTTTLSPEKATTTQAT